MGRKRQQTTTATVSVVAERVPVKPTEQQVKIGPPAFSSLESPPPPPLYTLQRDAEAEDDAPQITFVSSYPSSP